MSVVAWISTHKDVIIVKVWHIFRSWLLCVRVTPLCGMEKEIIWWKTSSIIDLPTAIHSLRYDLPLLYVKVKPWWALSLKSAFGTVFDTIRSNFELMRDFMERHRHLLSNILYRKSFTPLKMSNRRGWLLSVHQYHLRPSWQHFYLRIQLRNIKRNET